VKIGFQISSGESNKSRGYTILQLCCHALIYAILNVVVMSLFKMTNPTVENLVIIGSGPAGYTAAIYAGRA
jgi:NADPH-dependent 2,4-dienoyl-CoA reductase/sulfur reductase-like enzyme